MTPSPAISQTLTWIALAALMVAGGCKDDTSARRGDGRPAELKAQPNPLPPGPGAGKTTLSWRIGESGTAQVYVSVNGRPEKKVAEGHTGSKEIDWIHPGRHYQFKLYAGENRQKVLATLAVHKKETAGARTASGSTPAATTGTAVPSANKGASGTVTTGSTAR